MTTTLARITFTPASKVASLLFSDAQEMHNFTMRAVGDIDADCSPRARANVLWRTDVVRGKPTLTVQTTADGPDFDAWRSAPGVRDVAVVPDALGRLGKRLSSGRTLRFMVRANASRYVAAPGHGGRGKRRVPITDHDDLITWLARQGEGAFTLAPSVFDGASDVAVEQERPVRVDPRGAVLSSTSFRGTLVVADGDRLRDLVVAGLGRGRPFGLGLLQVA